MTSPLKFIPQLAVMLVALLVTRFVTSGAERPTVANFSLIDQDDANHELHRTPGRAVVLMFTGTGCPIVRKNALKFRDLKDRFEQRRRQFLAGERLCRRLEKRRAAGAPEAWSVEHDLPARHQAELCRSPCMSSARRKSWRLTPRTGAFFTGGPSTINWRKGRRSRPRRRSISNRR